MYRVHNSQPNFVSAPPANADASAPQQPQGLPAATFQNSAIPSEGVRPVIKRHGFFCKMQGWFGSHSPEHHHRVQREKDSLAKYDADHRERERRIAVVNSHLATGGALDVATILGTTPEPTTLEANEKDFDAAIDRLKEMKGNMERERRRVEIQTRKQMEKGDTVSQADARQNCRRLAKQKMFIKQTGDLINSVKDMKNTVQINDCTSEALGVVDRVMRAAQTKSGDPSKTVDAFIRQKQKMESAFAELSEAIELGLDPNGELDEEGAATEQRMADEIFEHLRRGTAGYVPPAAAQQQPAAQAAPVGQIPG
jgi:hypothetical protein